MNLDSSPPIMSVKEARELDDRCTVEIGIPSLLLMEAAGRALADAAEQALSSKETPVFVVCGVGNNAGDGFVAARFLSQRGISVHVVLVNESPNFKGDAALNYRIIEKLQIDVKSLLEFIRTVKLWKGGKALVIDAVLGTGFKPPLKEPMGEAIRQMNAFKGSHPSDVTVLAADIPSGLSGDEGFLGTDAVKADYTVTFGTIKKGMLVSQAKEFVGELVVADIGLPKKLFIGRQE